MRRHHHDRRPLALRCRGHQLPNDFEARSFRHQIVDYEQIERSIDEQTLGIEGARGGHDIVAFFTQRASEVLEDLLFVVCEQNAAARDGHSDGCGASPSSILMFVPAPGVLATVIWPPRPSMMFLAIGNPRPVPPRRVVKYGSNTRGRSS